ncbi:transcriptional regulator GlxA family with amidase domain [Roseibium hamelinense]|uniref:Transcriptional regulator GlxA family with amidase domain n=1 Tax=Roseibium hamelinense TaxID=150831 RepID=A0A562TIT8_9HYPH|nr:helix-turn-helix domain-containing protein [Roseibium hamelinense]MTI42607.1 helix-turn-helix domain-containing protein [Roseibium hamelinense]TWI93353.1 transcriptional regulator GlxA family with amidase domain [Roseibium hamelinense]
MQTMLTIKLISRGDPRRSVHYGLTDLFHTASEQAALLALPGVQTVSMGSAQVPAALLVLPPEPGSPERISPGALGEAVTGAHGKGAITGSICMGAFDLASTGLLDGRRATTHWTAEQSFKSQFPRVKLDCSQMLVDDGDIVTAGGMMAWTDLGLHLVERFLGPAVMLNTARLLLADPGGREQRFYATFHANLGHGDAPILSVQHALHAAPQHKWKVAAMATIAKLGERTFLRRFKAATGENPIRYLQLLRITRARERLESTTDTVSQIGWDLGYSDINAFRKVFLELVGLTPSEYRRRFSPRARRLTG